LKVDYQDVSFAGIFRKQDGQCKFNVTGERSRNHCTHGKVITVAYSEYMSVAFRYPTSQAHALY